MFIDLWSCEDDLNHLADAVQRDLKSTATKEIRLVISELQVSNGSCVYCCLLIFKAESRERLSNGLYGTLTEASGDMWVNIRKKFLEEKDACDSQIAVKLQGN